MGASTGTPQNGNTYLFINNRGDCYYQLRVSWKAVLSDYISNTVGYEVGLKFNESAWNNITGNLTSNSKLIKTFNSACRFKSLCIKTVLYNHRLIFPAAMGPSSTNYNKIFIIDKRGNCHEYDHKASDKSYIADYLDAYIKDTVGYESGFSLDANTWQAINNAINQLPNVIGDDVIAYKDGIRINAFNTLCKNKKYRIAAVCLDPSTIFP